MSYFINFFKSYLSTRAKSTYFIKVTVSFLMASDLLTALWLWF